MHRAGLIVGALCASALYALLGFGATFVYWLVSAPELSAFLRLLGIVLASFWIARLVRDRFDVPQRAMLIAWYIGSVAGAFVGSARLGTAAVATLVPTIVTLGMLPPVGRALSVLEVMRSLVANLLVAFIVWTGAGAAVRSASSSTDQPLPQKQ